MLLTRAQTELRDQIVPHLAPYVRRIRVFGSVARDEAHASSDVDLLVALKPRPERPPLGLQWFALEDALAEQLGRRVELVTEEALSPYIRPYIEQDAVLLYEG